MSAAIPHFDDGTRSVRALNTGDGFFENRDDQACRQCIEHRMLDTVVVARRPI
jgi:hypothetical protein